MIENKIKNYLNDKISIEQLVHYFDTYNYTQQQIKNNGIVYTPKYISDYIVQNLKPNPNETIFEPSVGHGIFIFSLLHYIQQTYNLSPQQLKQYFLTKVFVQDIMEQNIKEFKKIVIVYFQKMNVQIKENEIKNIFVGDTLKNTKNEYDIIFGNPPYVRVKNIQEDYLMFLRKNYKSCNKGNIDLYYAFIEYANKYSKRSSFIVPNSYIYNVSAKNLRNLIKENITKIIDFKQKSIFQNASTYTSIFVIDKSDKTNKIMYSNNLNSFTQLNKGDLDSDVWDFTQTKIPSINLKEVYFHTPIATLRDKIYITDKIKNKDTINFYKVSKVKNEKQLLQSKQTIIFPYELDDEQNKYKIKKQKQLQPQTIKYLNGNKEELNKRDKGKTDKYESWYAYGRKQGLNTYKQENYVIVIPGMISQQYKYFKTPVKNLGKEFLFSSGFLIETNENEANDLLKFLNSNEFKQYTKNKGKVWKGKDESSSYYSLTMTQLKQIIKKESC